MFRIYKGYKNMKLIYNVPARLLKLSPDRMTSGGIEVYKVLVGQAYFATTDGCRADLLNLIFEYQSLYCDAIVSWHF